MSRTYGATGLSFCVALASSGTWAFQPLLTDDTGTQGSGGNQLEISHGHSRESAPDVSQGDHELSFTYTRGITDSLDLSVASSARVLTTPEVSSPTHGWSNPALGAKWRFHDDESRRLSLALKPEVRFPVSSDRQARGMGSAKTSLGLALLATQQTAFGSVAVNAAVERMHRAEDAQADDERRTRWRISAAPVWSFAETAALALEGGITANPSRAENALVGYLQAALVYSPHEDIDLSAGLLRSSDGAVRTVRLTFGVTGRFR